MQGCSNRWYGILSLSCSSTSSTAIEVVLAHVMDSKQILFVFAI